MNRVVPNGTLRGVEGEGQISPIRFIEKGCVNVIKDVQEKKISFYTAECMEFETMGEVTECATLKEAFRIYQKMEQKRSGMGVGIGFILHDPDVPEYSDIHYPLYQGNGVERDLIALVEAYEKHPLVQKAQKDMQKLLDRKKQVER